MKYILCRACKMAAVFVVLPLLLAPAVAGANSFFFQFTNVFGGTSPDGSAPWVSSLFSDVKPGTVQIKISANELSGGEFLSAMFFNLDPGLNPTKLSFTYVGGSGGFALPTIKTGNNAFKVDGQGKYDIDFTFGQRAANEFTGNDYVIYDVTATAFTLTASDFDALSTAAGGCSQYLAAAEISGIPGTCDSTGTGFVAPCGVSPAPEPGTLALLGLGCGLGIFVRRGRIRRARQS